MIRPLFFSDCNILWCTRTLNPKPLDPEPLNPKLEGPVCPIFSDCNILSPACAHWYFCLGLARR